MEDLYVDPDALRKLGDAYKAQAPAVRALFNQTVECARAVVTGDRSVDAGTLQAVQLAERVTANLSELYLAIADALAGNADDYEATDRFIREDLDSVGLPPTSAAAPEDLTS